jgi:hypothetical protein
MDSDRLAAATSELVATLSQPMLRVTYEVLYQIFNAAMQLQRFQDTQAQVCYRVWLQIGCARVRS